MSHTQILDGKQQFLGVLRLVARLHEEGSWTEKDEDAVQGHFKRLQKGAKEGTVLIAGRTQVPLKDTFGIVIFEAADEAEAEAYMQGDPVVASGVMTYELHPYRVAVSR